MVTAAMPITQKYGYEEGEDKAATLVTLLLVRGRTIFKDKSALVSHMYHVKRNMMHCEI